MNRLINTSIFSAKKTPNRRGTCFGASHIPNPMSLPNRMCFGSKMTLCLFSYGGCSPAEDVELFLRDGKIFNPKKDFFFFRIFSSRPRTRYIYINFGPKDLSSLPHPRA